jgi:hypothetical protein
VEWDEAAKQRLERVPPGFMRDMTRSRVEKWARAAGRGRVDLETMDGKYGNWGAGGAKVELTLAWDAEAQARAERIPDFIRPMVQKEIERVVKGQGRGYRSRHGQVVGRRPFPRTWGIAGSPLGRIGRRVAKMSRSPGERIGNPLSFLARRLQKPRPGEA